MKKYLASLTFFLSLYFLIIKKPRKAFFSIVIPCFFLVPPYAKVFISGMSFNAYMFSILPIIIWFVLFKIGEYKFDKMDYLILIFLLHMFIGNCITNGIGGAPQKLITDIISVYGTYVLTKYFVENRLYLNKLLKSMVYLSSCIVVLCGPSELMISRSLVELYRKIWPIYYMSLQPARYGLDRIETIYEHPIPAGIIFSITTIISLFFIKKYYNDKRERIKFIILFLINLSGTIMTISRGPIAICFFMILIILLIHFEAFRIKMIAVVLLLISALVILPSVYKTSSEDNEQSGSTEYRMKVNRIYVEYIIKSPIWGYGTKKKIDSYELYRIPKFLGMVSIDNFYIAQSVHFGLLSTLIYMYISLFSIYMLLFKIIKNGSRNVKNSYIILVYLIIIILLNNYLVYNFYSTYTLNFILLGLVSGLYSKQNKENKKLEFHSFKRII